MYFPDDIWNIIKEFQGFKKYYLIPCNLKRNLFENDVLPTLLHNRLFHKVLCFLHSLQDEILQIRLIKIFDFLIHHVEILYQARKVSTIWDRFAFALASQCQNYLVSIHCGCNVCDNCYTYNCLEYVSRTFYTKYVNSGIE